MKSTNTRNLRKIIGVDAMFVQWYATNGQLMLCNSNVTDCKIMDLLILGCLGLLVASKSGVALEAENGLVRCSWDFRVLLFSVWGSPTALWRTTQKRRANRNGEVTLSVGR
eukprot:IDg7477t1